MPPSFRQQFEYAFDDIGNRTSASAGGDVAGANLRVASYSVNNLNQYTSRRVPGVVDILGAATNAATVTVNGQPAYRKGEYYRQELAFDNNSAAVYAAVTNMATLDSVSVTNTGNVFLPRSPEAFVYDPDGNLTNDGRWSYSWDAENRLVAMTNIATVPDGAKMALTFAYDWQSRRISKTVLTNSAGSYVLSYSQRFAYDGWNLLATLNSQLATLNCFTWGLDLSGSLQGAGGVGGLLAVSQISNSQILNPHLVCFDGNGNVTALVSAADGRVSANYEYSPFGELLRATGPAAKANPFRFSTKYQDDDTGLLYFGHRYYDPIQGCWLRRDPIEEDGGPNLCTFVGNDPVNNADALGLSGNLGINPFGQGIWGMSKSLDQNTWYTVVPILANFRASDKLPYRFLHHYIFDHGEDITLTPEEFLGEIKPIGSVYEPNNALGQGSLPRTLKDDIRSRPSPFIGTYQFGVFDTGNRTAGIGQATMTAKVTVCVDDTGKWSLSGAATLDPDKWDFDWTWQSLRNELLAKYRSGGLAGADSLKGRHIRAALGSSIPGRPFDVKVSGSVTVTQQSGDSWAQFSK